MSEAVAEHSRKRESKSKHRSSHTHTPEPQGPILLIDQPARDAHWAWPVLGLGLLTLCSVVSIITPLSSLPWIVIVAGFILTLGGTVAGKMPRPRHHPAALPSLLIVLGIPAIRLLNGSTASQAFDDPLFYGIAIAWIAVWLLRTKWAVHAAVVLMILLTELYLALHVPGGSFSTDALITRSRGVAALLYSGNWEQRLFLIFLATIVIAVLTQGRRERKRWDREKLLRIYMYIFGLLGIVGILLGMILPAAVPADTAPLLGLMFGVSLAARQRLIHSDPTRHPPRRPTPVWEWANEGRIALQSIGTGIADIFTGRVEIRTPDRRIDPLSPVILNPYSNRDPRWVPVCLHLHSNRWEGAFKPEEVVEHYSQIGAGAVILTDHNRITKADHPFATIHAYEHGWGWHSHHALAIGARKRLPETQPLGGGRKGRARTLARLRENSEMIILAHPRQKDAWSADDVSQFDYDALEIFNKSVDSFRRWEEALSSGRLVWGTAGDDGHDLRSRHQTGKRYLLVDLGDKAPDPGSPADPADVLEAMKSGRFIAVRQASREVTRTLPHPRLPVPVRFDWDSELLRITFSQPVDKLTVYGPFRVRQQKLTRADMVEVRPREGEGYVRLVAEHASYMMAFNPLARVKTN